MSGFIHGTTYYSHANPPEELKRNFRAMKSMGINTVRVAEIWPGWSVLEPDEDRYEWELLDDYVEKAAAEGLNIVMGIGINDTPIWCYVKFPGLRFKSSDGRRSNRRVQSACFDHPGYREHMSAFIRAVTRRYKSADGIIAWQFGNEVRYNVKNCDCDASRLRFRLWLRERYGEDLAALNREWGTRYRDWDEIYPYKSGDGPPTAGCTPHLLRSYEFQGWSVEELIRWGTGIIREESKLPVFHNCMNISGTAGSQWKLTEACDFAVIDIYAVTCQRPGLYNGYLTDTMASIARLQSKALWIGETSAGQYGTYNRIPVDRRLVENCVADQIGAGAKAVFYFRHKSPLREQPHKFTGSQSMLRTDESETEYVETPKHIAAFMAKQDRRIASAEPVRPQIAVYHAAETMALGQDAGFFQEAFDSAFGARGLWSAGQFPVDILDTEALTAVDLSEFKIIHLPLTCLLPAAVGEKLKQFTAEGGTLISEGRPGYVDENGLLYPIQPGAGLHEVFGCREDLFYNIKEYEVIPAVSREGTQSSGAGSEDLHLPYLKQCYRLCGGTAIFTDKDGRPCAVRHRYGKGRAVIIGGLPSLYFGVGRGKYGGGSSELPEAAAEDGVPSAGDMWSAFFSKIAAEAGVKRPIEFSGGHSEVSARYLQRTGEIIAFFINYSDTPAAQISFPSEVLRIGSSPAEEEMNVPESAGVGKKDGGREEKCRELSLAPLSWTAVSVQKNG